MAQSCSISSLGSDFDSFLFASIGEDRNGMQLSVISALARLDIDPWQEAASLADMSREAATRHLASLIEKSPGEPAARGDSATIAARLIALLPQKPHTPVFLRKRRGDLAPAISVRTIVVIYLVFMTATLGTQLLSTNHQSSVPSGGSQSTDNRLVSPQIPSQNSD